MFALLRDRKFLHATALLVGTMVGVGIFGIPFVFAQSGFLVGTIFLVVLSVIAIFTNLAFAELTLRTQGEHQIPGYANIWLGHGAQRVAFAALILSGYGTLLAYLIVAGGFLHTVLAPYIGINPDLYAVLFAVFWSSVTLVRLRTVAAVDLFVATAVVMIVGVLTAVGVRHIDWGYFSGGASEYWFLPYGVLAFAISGANAIPLQRQLLIGREKLLKPAIITAVVLVALLYLLFAFTVVGVSGGMTTPDAIAGLSDILGSGIVVLGSLFGIMTISTSFLMMSATLYETFRIDYRLHRASAWLLVIVPPLLLFWSGLRNFINVIGLIGSVAVGVLTILILAAYLKARKFPMREPEFTIRLPTLIVRVFMVISFIGIFYAFFIR